MDPLEELELTTKQRSILTKAAAAEYRNAASSILEPYGFALSEDGEIVHSDDLEEDPAQPWDEEAARNELDAISLAWTPAFAEAASAHNALMAAHAALAEAQAIRDAALVRAAQAGVGPSRLAEALGIPESTVDRIITAALGR
jgi:DNA-directed RNA polymerase specialized sigma24 family protein